jgi:Mg-chelatase subunit ChlD
METRSDPTHYDTLGVPADAGQDAIRRAFFDLARRLHPDVNPSPGVEDRMKQINAAYAVLSDPAARAAYDNELALRRRYSNPPINTPQTHNGGTTMETSHVVTETRRGGEIAIPMPLVPQSFHQLGIFVLDGSGSMTEEVSGGGMTKADAVNGAVRDLFTRFKASRQKSNFSFAVVAFDEDASVHLDVTPAAGVDDNADYNPLDGHGGGTFIGGGLEVARGIAERFLAGARPDIPASVVIVVMSDGECGSPDATIAVAEGVKRVERVTVCATHFARVGHSDPAAQATLKKIATDPVRGYKTVYDAESLRVFFIASVSAGRAI